MTKHDATPGISQKIRILVADDYEINQKLALLILKNAGYQAEIVENGQQAMEIYQKSHFDLILMDIQMPLMDGYEATKRIRNWEDERRNGTGKNSESISDTHLPDTALKQIPIIAMTGDATENAIKTCRKKGMNDCIGKPLQRDQLLSAVQRWSIAGSNAPHNKSEMTTSGHSYRNPQDDQPPLDLKKAVDKFLGKKDILYGALEALINSVRDRIITIRQACSVRDHEAIAAAAHGIKGGAANLTADRLADLASKLEEVADRQVPEQAIGLVDKIEEQLQQLEHYFNQNCIL